MSFCVLLSVYKNENPIFFSQALASIWDEQYLKPSQIVLVKDGPLTDDLEKVIDVWDGKIGNRLTVLSLQDNVGLGEALNAGLSVCRYELVARMDTDDIALPHRFSSQVSFMEKYPEISASSSAIEEWDENMERLLDTRSLPIGGKSLRSFSKLRSPLNHPATIFRKSDVLAVGGYPSLRKAQDYALWSLMIKKNYTLANLPDVLLKMRAGYGLLSRRGWGYFQHELTLLRYQRDIGFINYCQYVRGLFIRGGGRLSPSFVKEIAYKYFR
ncbi:glycosyltransferase [Halomonas sp. SL1]|uniref:glycosyltransferase n=1 Tax=Halomonas sp. SL1 TaxID=2137478 RepID=UPI000D167269|nr:glycosyltransferase [Halomonas sp. SL1]RAH38226.1 glycosyltransferase [Halomonas sp. SL1]